MALLDEFVIRYLSDTGALDRDMDESRRKSDQLNEALEETDDTALSLGRSLRSMALGALAGLAAAAGAGSIVQNAIGRAEDIVTLDRTARAIGATTEEVDALSRSMNLLGVDSQTTQSTLVDMSNNIRNAMLNMGSSQAMIFNAMGVSLRDINGEAISATDAMFQLADSVQNMDRATATFRLAELGVTDEGMVEAILNGRAALEEMVAQQKEQGVVTRENVEEARRFVDGMNAFRQSTASVRDGISQFLLPALTWVIGGLTTIVDWMSENRTVVIAFFAAVAAIVTAVYLPAMIAAAAATLAATWPILLMVAAVTAIAAAFALAYDDIMTFIRGGDSFIGQIFEKFPQVERIVRYVMGAFREMGATLGEVYDFLVVATSQGIEWVVDGLTWMVDQASSLFDRLVSALGVVGNAIRFIFDSMVDGMRISVDFIMAAVDRIIGAFRSVANAGRRVGRFFGFGGEEDTAEEALEPTASRVPEQPRRRLDDALMDSAAVSSSGIEVTWQEPPEARAAVEAAEVIAVMDDAVISVEAANDSNQAAQSSPLNSLTSNAISNTSNVRENTVTVGQITVETEATDADGIADGIGDALSDQLRDLDAEFSSGVAR